MNELQTFDFESKPVRTLTIGGEPWWVAKDVAEALGYPETSNPARLFAHVPEEWRGVNPIDSLGCEVNPIHLTSRARKTQDMLCLSEQGLYFFLGRSDKPAALPFQKWIAGEVIPSIRKTGGYAASPRREAGSLTGAYLRELNAAYEKSIIGRDDWRRMAGLDPLPDPAGNNPLSQEEKNRQEQVKPAGRGTAPDAEEP
jgi:prophage antirepressor-like protein